MKKQKPKPKKTRVRRNPYARALEIATSRLEKASMEYRRCESRMAELTLEIPKLADMIRSLGGYFEKTPSAVATEALLEIHHEPAPAAPIPKSPLDLVPEHLKRFITPHPSTMRLTQAGGAVSPALVAVNDDDGFLNDNIGGVEILP